VNETERRIAIASTDTATPATILRKPPSENDPRYPTRKRNPSRLPSKKPTPRADLRSSQTAQTASKSKAPADASTLSKSSLSTYPLGPVKTVCQLPHPDFIVTKNERRRKTDLVAADTTTPLVPHATSLLAPALTIAKKTPRNPPSYLSPPQQHQHPKTKTRTKLSAKPVIVKDY
jgi:hypothetical protein